LTGGYVLEFASWRVIFLMIMPLCGTGLLLGWWLLPALKRPERRQLDQYGLLSVAIAVTTFLLALSQGRREGWDSQGILALFAVAAVATVVFIAIELRHAQPLVELRLFRSAPFVMAIAVMCLTTMAFRSTGPMFPVLMQRILGFEPIVVALTMLPSQIIYGVFVLLVGRLSDRVSPQLLVLFGLGLYVVTFVGYAEITVWTTVLTMTTFLTLRFIAEGFIVSPNNLTALRALPEHQVMMASGLIGLLRSISNTLGPAVSAVLWDDRYSRHLQQFAENSPVDSFGFMAALQQFHAVLRWTGEIAVMIPTKSMALVGRLLHTEASTAAWQDYLLFNAFLAFLALFPALGVQYYLWRKARSHVADARQERALNAPDRPTGTSETSRAPA
jgi:MFS family permease